MKKSDNRDEEKKQRLAQALRANLRRRKDQARERRETPDSDDPDDSNA